ncbi:MAG: hypothetical protein ACRDHX_12620, partial [Chloroflexota bacterium]
ELHMVQRYLAGVGALHYTWVVAQTIRRKLLKRLEELAVQGLPLLADACAALIPPLPAMTTELERRPAPPRSTGIDGAV